MKKNLLHRGCFCVFKHKTNSPAIKCMMLFALLCLTKVTIGAEAGDMHRKFVRLDFKEVNSLIDVKVKGKVLDEKGVPVPGVTVKVEGTNLGAITNGNGEYEITAPEGAKITFSYLGYNSETITVGSSAIQTSNINLTVNTAGKQLNDVVVVGYGTLSQRAVTGSISTVKYDNFKDRSFNNVTQALAGQLPGVNITQGQGSPGSSPIIKIRGTSSITAGTNPLYVVDGLPLENFNLNLINTQDIASVDILKDASSTAIYGSRGANGVILVTTKLGRPGQTTISATVEYGVQDVLRRLELMDAQQYIQYYVDAHNNAWTAAGGNASDPNSVRGSAYKIPEDFTTNPAQFGVGTDWQDVMFRTAPSRNAQLSVSGGTEKTQFMFSAGLLDQDAVLDRNYYKRLSLRSNIKHQISDRFTVGTNLSFTGIFDRTGGTAGKSDVVSLALQSVPIFPVYNENGNLGFRDPNSTWYRFVPYSDLIIWHPYSLTREISQQNKTFNTLATGFLEYKILDALKFRTSLNGNMSNGRDQSYRNKNQKYGYSSNLPAEGFAGSIYSLNWLNENTLTYDTNFGSHGLNALVGYTSQHQRDEYASLTSTNFPNDLVPTLNAGTASSGTSTASEWSMLSYLARVNYNYNQKYFLTGTIRRDGSSRFGTNTKWGYFPSVSAGWQVSDEDFLKDVSWINRLKLRTSYGVAGNNQIPNYGPVSLLSSLNYASGSSLANGLTVANISNPDLKWEKTNQFNVGVDLSVFNNRVNFTGEYYNSITNDLLLNVPVPDITGFATQLTNIGKVKNSGYEFSLATKNTVGAFKWTTDFNLSYNRNKVLKLGPGNAPLIFTDFVVTVKTEVGQPVSNFYGYIFDGVYNNRAQIDGSPHDAGATPGDPIVRDVNGDGVINANDRTTIGNAQPDFTSGITNTFTFKGFEFSFMFQGSFGGEIANQLTRYNGIWNGGRNAYAEVANYWKSESNPGDGKHFKPSVNPSALVQSFSNYWIEDASYVRLKNIRLGYTLPEKFIERTPAKGVRLYVNAENVHLFSKYKNYDPENTTYAPTTPSATASSAVPSGAFVGVDYGSYPAPRVITFGAKVDF
ncbi:SusC/RagA family TonB-linked outer membrane protein [Pedobacter immunditicola]|uniref:SusC/RagA family TonB-linked outer membrane protein n=1 Tax=Pedobacter immunditicola TaxID=3133440 RepID=UPI003098E165